MGCTRGRLCSGRDKEADGRGGRDVVGKAPWISDFRSLLAGRKVVQGDLDGIG